MVSDEYWREQPALEAIRIAKLCGCDCMVEVARLYKVDNLYWRASLRHRQRCKMDVTNYFKPKDTDE